MVIERATPDDRASLMALLRTQLADHDIHLDDARLGATIDGVFADPSRGMFVVAREHEVVGLGYLSFTWCIEHGGKSAWLEELYVRPESRSRGIGGELLRACLDEATRAGCRAVDLEVESSHARAANVYLRMGFRPHTRARWVRTLG